MSNFNVGQTTPGGSSGNYGGLTGLQITMPQDGILQSLSMFWVGNPAGAPFILGLYSDSGNAPATLLATTGVQAAVPGTQTVPTTTNPTVTAGTKCWVVIDCQTTPQGFYDSGSGVAYFLGSFAWTGSLPATAPAGSGGAFTFSMYATFSTTGGSGGGPKTWASSGADTGGSGAYVAGTQSVQYLHDNFAADGDTITLPSGTFTWPTGVTLTKALKVAGHNTAGSTKVVQNSNGACFVQSPSSTVSIELSWIGFSCAAGVTAKTGHFIVVSYVSGALPFLIHDCQFASKSALLSQILTQQNGGLISHCGFDGGNTDTGGGINSIDECIQFKQPNVDLWKTVSTMGLGGDPSGNKNTYVEDCTFSHAPTEALDFDDGSRVVVRHCTFTDAAIASHGYDTSPWGTRHWEIYDNTFKYPHSFFDAAAPDNAPYLILRGGTGVVTGNVMQPIGSQNWGAKSMLCWLSDGVTQGTAGKCYTVYPAARQVGQSWNGSGGGYSEAAALGTGYFTDPAYVYGNTVDNAFQSGTFSQDWINNTGCSGGHTSQEFIQANRDFFLNAGAKPGWTRYTYPHPLNGGGTSGGGGGGGMAAFDPAMTINTLINQLIDMDAQHTTELTTTTDVRYYENVMQINWLGGSRIEVRVKTMSRTPNGVRLKPILPRVGP